MRGTRLVRQTGIEAFNNPYHRLKGKGKLQNAELFEPTQDEFRGILSGRGVKKLAKNVGLAPLLGTQVQPVVRVQAEQAYEPPLKRKWLSGPLSRLSTAYTRQDWFRVMHANILADQWTPHTLTDLTRQQMRITDPTVIKFYTTPVADVLPFIPKFARDGAADSDPDFLPFDHALDGADGPPPFLTNAFRAAHLANEVGHYKPDIICLNEVPRNFAFKELWTALRPMGYGMYYMSSRGHSVTGDCRGLLTTKRAWRVPDAEDIGNLVLYHKGRFCPFHASDIPPLYTVSLNRMRDKITQMNILLACVQLTPGVNPEAVEQRQHEAVYILKFIDAAYFADIDRYHTTVVICGDLNNITDDEPCVETFRNRFFSAYDIAGGPRWTAWYHEGAAEMNRYGVRAVAKRETDRAGTLQEQINASEMHKHVRPVIPGTRPTNVYTPPGVKALPTARPPNTDGATNSAAKRPLSTEAIAALEKNIPDKLMLRHEIQKREGVVQRTQDFIFHNPEILALLQLLDVPDEGQIDPLQLLPCKINPSHHVPLVVDMSWNDTAPMPEDHFNRRRFQAP